MKIRPLLRHGLCVLLLIHSFPVLGQKLKDFAYSPCYASQHTDSLRDEDWMSRILSISTHKNTTTTRLKTYQNCVGKFLGHIRLSEDRLDLGILIRPTKIDLQENYNLVETIEFALCNCLYTFTFIIEGFVFKGNRKVYINGRTLADIDDENRIKEEPVPDIPKKNE